MQPRMNAFTFTGGEMSLMVGQLWQGNSKCILLLHEVAPVLMCRQKHAQGNGGLKHVQGCEVCGIGID